MATRATIRSGETIQGGGGNPRDTPDYMAPLYIIRATPTRLPARAWWWWNILFAHYTRHILKLLFPFCFYGFTPFRNKVTFLNILISNYFKGISLPLKKSPFFIQKSPFFTEISFPLKKSLRLLKKSPCSSRIHPAFRRNLFAFEVDTQCTVHRAKFLKTESILQKYINRQSIVKISTLQCITHRGVDLVPLESKTLYNYERFINNHINQEPSWAGFIQKWGKNPPEKKARWRASTQSGNLPRMEPNSWSNQRARAPNCCGVFAITVLLTFQQC